MLEPVMSNEVGLAPNQPVWLTNFVDQYQKLSVDNLELLSTIYHTDVVFQDPIHEIKGFDALNDYFKNLYQNLAACYFVVNKVLCEDDQAAVYWTMTYVHPKLANGKAVSVEGHSLLKGADNKVIYHRDYLDVGAMVYEHVPVIGKAVRWLKNRMAG